MFRLSFAARLTLPILASAQPATHQVKLNGNTFTLPKGFTIELAAGADMAPRPIAAAFDEKGRLYVTDSSGSNANVKEQLEKKPHRIVRLESTKGDGKFDKQTVFVKNVMLPQGAMWLNGSLYVAAPPHIMKFTDTNDDGVADKEEIWFDGKTLTGCANDLHGPYRGPDGRIYWTKGAFAKQEYTVNGKKFTSRASHIFRATPDGKNLEPIMTGGMDNPVDLVFTPGGDIIFSTTFFQHPAGGKRDGLIHAVYGGVYGKDHDVVYEHPWTSPNLMPVLTHMGPAAPCGLHRYESDQFGKEYDNNIFCCQFNLRKVSRHILVPKGSTYETKDSDFVVSDNIDFHPTDVIEDADGSLLVVDTGGWYKLCCPTSQLVKPDVTGAIYRVKKDGAHKIRDPRGEKITWRELDENDLGHLFHDPRPAVRQRATDTAATSKKLKRSDVAEAAMKAGKTEHGMTAAMWLCGHSDTSATAIPAAHVAHPNEEVRKAALHVLALHRQGGFNSSADKVRPCLTDHSLAVRRIAAMALGRMNDGGSIFPIFEVLADEKNDHALDHAFTHALTEIGSVVTARGLPHASPRVRRACLSALDNIPTSGLGAGDVFPHLDAKEAVVRDTAWWIAGRHPQWGDRLADYFKEKLKTIDKLTPAERDELAARLTKFASNAAVQKVIAEAIGVRDSAPLALNVMARAGLKSMPTVWRDELLVTAPHLDNRDALKAALGVFRVLPLNEKDYDDFIAKLPRLKLWPGGVVPDEFRLALLAARPAGVSLNVPTTSYLLGKLDREEAAGDRATAADVLARSKLTGEQFASLAGALKAAHPLDLAKLLGLFAKTTDQNVGLALVKALREKGVRSALRVEMVKPILDKFPKPVTDEAEKLYAELAEARKGETARLEKILADLKPGDIRRGQLVFNSAKTQCVACHKVGYVGGDSGPDLTKIGSIRTERDLLESILYPSASFVRSYEPVRVVTTDERTLNGVLKKDAPDEITVVVAADKEERIARADVESIAPSAVSLMPAGLEQQLTPQEIADLIAFLRACK